jgi:hypothetical protein
MEEYIATYRIAGTEKVGSQLPIRDDLELESESFS